MPEKTKQNSHAASKTANGKFNNTKGNRNQKGQASADGRRNTQRTAQKKGRPAYDTAKKNDAGAERRTSKNTANRKEKAVPALPIHYTVLGGLNEIGKNMAVFEYGDDAFIIDCGMSFPYEDLLGVDVVLPDFSYILTIVHK